MMPRYRDDRSTLGTKSTTPSQGETSKAAEARELRARAARYRKLAEALHDPHVVAQVRLCARELETEANWLEKQAPFGARIVKQRYRISG